MASHLEISPAAETATLRNSGTVGMDCFGCSDAAILGRPALWVGKLSTLAARSSKGQCRHKRRDYRPWDLPLTPPLISTLRPLPSWNNSSRQSVRTATATTENDGYPDGYHGARREGRRSGREETQQKLAAVRRDRKQSRHGRRAALRPLSPPSPLFSSGRLPVRCSAIPTPGSLSSTPAPPSSPF